MENQNNNVDQTLPSTKNGWSQKKIIIVGAAIVVGLYLIQSLVFSPERIAERMMENATDGEYDVSIDDDGNYSITSNDGQNIDITAGNETKIPDNWPNSVPLPTGAEVSYAAVIGGQEDGTASTVNFRSNDTSEEIINFYKEELAGNGWAIEAEVATGDGHMLSATQGENNMVSVYTSTSNSVTDVTVSVQTTN